ARQDAGGNRRATQRRYKRGPERACGENHPCDFRPAAQDDDPLGIRRHDSRRLRENEGLHPRYGARNGMTPRLLIGVSGAGVVTPADPNPDIETRFRMVRESGVFDYYDRTPPPAEIDLWKRAS